MIDRAVYRPDGSLLHAPNIYPGEFHYRPNPKQLRMIRLMCKYPPYLWNKRLRKHKSLMLAMERLEKLYWDHIRAWEKTWGPVYDKLAAKIEAADVEWDRTHEWDEETQRWRRKT